MHLTAVTCLMIKEVIQQWRYRRFRRGPSGVVAAIFGLPRKYG